MGTSTVLVVSDREEDVIKLRPKLIMLRDISNVISSPVSQAVGACKRYIPDIIVVCVNNRDDKYTDICKIIRKDPVFKAIPVIFIFDNYDEEVILSAFDAGISDYLISPVREKELLMRIIWSLQKGQIIRELERKETFLADFGIIDRKTGIYASQYTPRIFSNEIAAAQKYKDSLVFMAVSVDIQHKNTISDNYLIEIIRKSMRMGDLLGSVDNGKVLLSMSKTNIDGANSLYNRITENAGKEITFSAGACEFVEGMTYENLSSNALNALDEAINRGGGRIIICDKINKNESNKSDTNEELPAQKAWLGKIQTDKRGYYAFKEEFIKKIECEISPIFFKMKQDLTKRYHTYLIVDQAATGTKCFFSIKEPYEKVELLLKIVDPGFAKVIIDTITIKPDDQSNKRTVMDLNELTGETITILLERLFNDFRSIVGLKD